MQIFPGAPPIINTLITAVIVAICTTILNWLTVGVSTKNRLRAIERHVIRLLDNLWKH